MKILLIILVVFLLTGCGSGFETEADPQGDGWISLFDGKSTEGWHISRTSHQGTNPDLRVEDGALVLRQDPYGQGGIVLTDARYADFELYVEVKIDSFCNGGIFLRSTESGQAYQVELALPGGHGNLLGERLEVSVPAEAEKIGEVWKAGDWNTFRIRMTDSVPRIRLWVNDVMMWDVQQTRNDFIAGARTGMIGFQSHWSALYLPTPGGFHMPGAWRPGAAHRFRNIHIRELAPVDNRTPSK